MSTTKFTDLSNDLQGYYCSSEEECNIESTLGIEENEDEQKEDPVQLATESDTPAIEATKAVDLEIYMSNILEILDNRRQGKNYRLNWQQSSGWQDEKTGLWYQKGEKIKKLS
jgi:hypothetical protein